MKLAMMTVVVLLVTLILPAGSPLAGEGALQEVQHPQEGTCHGATSTERPVTGAGVLNPGGLTSQGLRDTQDRSFYLVIQSNQWSHGYVHWRLLDDATGTEWMGGITSETPFPFGTPPSPYAALCLVLTNDSTSVRHYAFSVTESDLGP